jgi:hypothetical protein
MGFRPDRLVSVNGRCVRQVAVQHDRAFGQPKVDQSVGLRHAERRKDSHDATCPGRPSKLGVIAFGTVKRIPKLP